MVLFPGIIARRGADVVADRWLRPVQLAAAPEFGVLVRHRSAGLRRLFAQRVRRPAQRDGRCHRGDRHDACIGALIGLVAGFFGGKIDAVISRIVDIFYGLPLILGRDRALSAISLPGIWGVVLALTLLGWAGRPPVWCARKTIEAKGQDYTMAARALGASNPRIMFRHILPNAIGPSIVLAVISLGAVHRRRGDVVLPGSGHPAPGLLLGHDDRRRPGRRSSRRPGRCWFPRGLPDASRCWHSSSWVMPSVKRSIRSCGGDGDGADAA